MGSAWSRGVSAATAALVLLGLCAAAPAPGDGAAYRPADPETLIGDTTVYDSIKAVVMSQDARHVAFLGLKGDKQFIVTDNVPGPTYDWIIPDSLFVLPGGQSTYIVQNDETMQVSIDGRLGKAYPSIEFNRLFVSPDGKKVAYIAVRADKKMVVVLDGQEGPVFDSVDFPLFSPDSQHLAYRAISGGKMRIVVDGNAQSDYDGIIGFSLSFSPDSRRVGYEAIRKDQHVIVIDGHEAVQCNQLRAGPGFSPDSKRWAAAMSANPADPASAKTAVIMDGKVGPTYDAIFAGDMRFSPDSKHFAFGALHGKQAFIVIDGVEKAPIDDMGSHTLVFSPDSAHYAFAAISGPDQVVVSDGNILKPWKAIEAGTPLFSPDSKQLAYVGQFGRKWVEVIDGKEMDPWDLAGVPVYSPDSRHVAYRVVNGKQGQAVVDGVASLPYDGIGPIAFSLDSRHTVYTIFTNSASRICIDGIPSVATFDQHIPDNPAAFDDNNTAHLISVRGGKFYRVTLKMPAK